MLLLRDYQIMNYPQRIEISLCPERILAEKVNEKSLSISIDPAMHVTRFVSVY